MISHLKGVLCGKNDDRIVVEVGGIGFQLNLARDEIAGLGAPGEEITVHTCLVVREDALTLYGFLAAERLEFFERLVQVSGIGPKTALAITGTISFEVFRNAIFGEDVKRLSALPGIGRKTAQRLVLELGDKLEVPLGAEGSPPASGGFKEAKDALQELGFSFREIEGLLQEAVRSGHSGDSQDLVKYVLQRVGNREG